MFLVDRVQLSSFATLYAGKSYSYRRYRVSRRPMAISEMLLGNSFRHLARAAKRWFRPKGEIIPDGRKSKKDREQELSFWK